MHNRVTALVVSSLALTGGCATHGVRDPAVCPLAQAGRPAEPAAVVVAYSKGGHPTIWDVGMRRANQGGGGASRRRPAYVHVVFPAGDRMQTAIPRTAPPAGPSVPHPSVQAMARPSTDTATAHARDRSGNDGAGPAAEDRKIADAEAQPAGHYTPPNQAVRGNP